MVRFGAGFALFDCQMFPQIFGVGKHFEDYGEEGEGIYQVCHCTNCSAEITYRIPFDNENKISS